MVSILRTTTLALGASLVGSLLPMAILASSPISVSILCLGVACILHGTGFLQEYIVRTLFRFWRKRSVIVGVISDLPFQGQGHAPINMPPERWVTYLQEVLPTKTRVKKVKISSRFTQWCLDRYNAIINPYGSVYPKVDVNNLSILKRIVNYVEHGGLLLNIADLPFFCMCDVKTQSIYVPTRVDVPHYYKRIIHVIERHETRMYSSPLSAYDYPFAKWLSLEVFATEVYRKAHKGHVWHIHPLETGLRIKDGSVMIPVVKIHRAIAVGENVESLTERMVWPTTGERRRLTVCTPLCFVHHGRGAFLISLLWLDQQTADTQKAIIDTFCRYIKNAERRHSPAA